MQTDDDVRRLEVECRWNEKYEGRIVWRAEVRDDAPGWVVMCPSPPASYDGDPDQWMAFGPQPVIRLCDKVEVLIPHYLDWPTASALLRATGDADSEEYIQQTLRCRAEAQQEREQPAFRASLRRPWWRFRRRRAGFDERPPPRNASRKQIARRPADLDPYTRRWLHPIAYAAVRKDWDTTGNMPPNLLLLRLALIVTGGLFVLDWGTPESLDEELVFAHRVLDTIWDILDARSAKRPGD